MDGILNHIFLFDIIKKTLIIIVDHEKISQ